MATVYTEFSQVRYAWKVQKLRDRAKWLSEHLKGSLNFVRGAVKGSWKVKPQVSGRKEAAGSGTRRGVGFPFCPPADLHLRLHPASLSFPQDKTRELNAGFTKLLSLLQIFWFSRFLRVLWHRIDYLFIVSDFVKRKLFKLVFFGTKFTHDFSKILSLNAHSSQALKANWNYHKY